MHFVYLDIMRKIQLVVSQEYEIFLSILFLQCIRSDCRSCPVPGQVQGNCMISFLKQKGDLFNAFQMRVSHLQVCLLHASEE